MTKLPQWSILFAWGLSISNAIAVDRLVARQVNVTNDDASSDDDGPTFEEVVSGFSIQAAVAPPGVQLLNPPIIGVGNNVSEGTSGMQAHGPYKIAVSSDDESATVSNDKLYSITVSASDMISMLQAAQRWAAQQKAAGASGGESSHNYYKFCDKNLALTMIAYDDASQGSPHAFGFQEYYNIAKDLEAKAAAKNNGSTWEGVLEDAQSKPFVDIIMTTCFEDVDVDPKNPPPDQTNPDSQAPDNPNAPGNDAPHSLRKRARQPVGIVQLRGTDNLWLEQYTTTKRVPMAQMDALIRSAVDTLRADSGGQQSYVQFTAGLEGIGTEIIPAELAERLVQYRPAVQGTTVDRRLLLRIFAPLKAYSESQRWAHRRTETTALQFVITQGRRGPAVGRLAWGDNLFQTVQNPPARQPLWQRFNCFRAPSPNNGQEEEDPSIAASEVTSE